MQVFITMAETNCSIDVPTRCQVKDIKAAVVRSTGIALEQVVLSFAGAELLDEQQAAEVGIRAQSTLVLTTRDEDAGEELQRLPRCCTVNSYDNVRVMRGQMTIRCRVCEKKIRAPVERVKQWKCEKFWSSGDCKLGDACPNLHLHFRKKSLKERVETHGPKVLDPVFRAQGTGACKDPTVLALLEKFSQDRDRKAEEADTDVEAETETEAAGEDSSAEGASAPATPRTSSWCRRDDETPSTSSAASVSDSEDTHSTTSSLIFRYDPYAEGFRVAVLY